MLGAWPHAMGAWERSDPVFAGAARAPRDRPPGRGDRAERAPASERASERQRASPRTGGRSSRGYSEPRAPRSASGPWRPRRASASERTRPRAPASVATDWGPKLAGYSERPGLCGRSPRAPRSASGPWRPRRASASERTRLRAPASVATDWGPKLAGVLASAATRSLRAKPARPAIGLRAVATAPSERQRANAPASASERRHGLGAEARGGIQARNGGVGAQRPGICGRSPRAPRSASGPWRPRRASASERTRLRAPASVATDWGPKLAGVFRASASERRHGLGAEARGGIQSVRPTCRLTSL